MQGRIQLPNGQPPAMQIASVLNDVQLVGLMASQIAAMQPDDLPAAAIVTRAIELLVETIVQCDGGQGIVQKVRERKQKEAE